MHVFELLLVGAVIVGLHKVTTFLVDPAGGLFYLVFAGMLWLVLGGLQLWQRRRSR